MDTTSDSAFSYQPPPGGDISLRSSDGDIFLAHSLILRLASSVFADMFSTATQSDTVELSDDSESVSLMLRFVYPPVFLDNLSTELLEKSLRIAQKYDISGIITAVDHIMISHVSDQHSVIYLDPPRALCLAAKYQLPQSHKAAIEQLLPERWVFDNTGEIPGFASVYPGAASIIGLLGAHCVRVQSLLDLLLGAGVSDVLPTTTDDDNEADIMMCSRCFKHEGHELGLATAYDPSWCTHWRTLIFTDVATGSLDDYNHYFHINILREIARKLNVCHDCINAARTALNGAIFDHWANKAKRTIEITLEQVKHLYEL
ncbi:hypothetical protein FRC12_018240 [Ceratobasidium sp. 428]|nr:hypothetical protein FRC12_018240 [Ceratobasidium sp. 428]